jgi:dihydrofolate reductase
VYPASQLTTTTQVSVDGVRQANGGPNVLDVGFEGAGWARPLFGSEATTFVNQVYERADAFLFGRRTYELFAGYWGVMDLGSGPIADALNTRPKYVASTTLTNPQWADTTVLSGGLAAAIGELKAKPAGELQVHGSGALTRWLLENDLVDEMNLLIVPVVVGQGTRLFPDTGPDMALDLVESRAFPNGITIQVYRPLGARSMQPTEARDIGAAVVPKVVFSKTLPQATWQNSTLIRDDAAQAIAKLKDEPGKVPGRARELDADGEPARAGPRR